MKINQYLINHYLNYDENSRLVSKHGSVEFLTTMHYIEKYIKRGLVFAAYVISDGCSLMRGLKEAILM